MGTSVAVGGPATVGAGWGASALLGKNYDRPRQAAIHRADETVGRQIHDSTYGSIGCFFASDQT